MFTATYITSFDMVAILKEKKRKQNKGLNFLTLIWFGGYREVCYPSSQIIN